jgi:hypothetical protein
MTKPEHWLTDVGQSIRDELSGDAPLIAQDLFGDSQPDVKNVDDTQLGRFIGQAYLANDRTTLTKYAKQNPSAFLRVWKQMGGTVPPKPVDQNQTVTNA